MPRLWEIVDNLPAGKRPRLIRGDVGYGGDENMREAERRGLAYLFKVRRTKTVLSLFRRHENDRDWADAGAGWEAREAAVQLGGWERPRRCVLLRRPSKDVRRIAAAAQPRRRGRPKKNARARPGGIRLRRGQGRQAPGLLRARHERRRIRRRAPARPCRGRGDCENSFDEYKNQYGWGGFVTKDLKPCRAIAPPVAIAANWWNVFCRLADGDRRLEPTTSRPMYMGVVGRLAVSGRQRLLRLTSTHLKAGEMRESLMRIGEFMRRIYAIAEQLDPDRVWELIIRAAFRKWLGGNAAAGLLPRPLALIA